MNHRPHGTFQPVREFSLKLKCSFVKRAKMKDKLR
jgi:hypothetical protein